MHRLLASFVLCLALATPAQAGNVLVPGDSSATSLGLVPNAKSLSETASLTATKAPAAKAPAAMTPIPSTSTQTQQAVQPRALEVTEEMKVQAILKSEKLQEQLNVQRPPVIMNEPDLSVFAAEKTKGEKSVNILVSNQFSLTLDEVVSIKNSVGYEQSQILDACQLRLQLIIMTDKTPRNVYVMSGQQSTIKYDGAITKLQSIPSMVCQPPKTLPQRGRPILKTATGKYAVLLNGIGTCPSAPNALKAITLQYTGNGNVTCSYQ